MVLCRSLGLGPSMVDALWFLMEMEVAWGRNIQFGLWMRFLP